MIDPGFVDANNHRPRIGFDARYISDRYHGIGRYAFRLLESLIAASPEFTFVIFRGNEPDSRFDWNPLAAWSNVEFQSGPGSLYWPHEQLIWLWLLHKNQIDLFHSPYFVAPLFATQPSIITVHDLIFDRYPNYMPMSWSRPYYRLLMKFSTRQAVRIVAVSRATAHDLQDFYPDLEHKIEIIPEGVETAFRPLDALKQSNKLRDRYDLKDPYILTVGARRPHKNSVNLIKAFAGLYTDYDHDLVFAGPSDHRFPDDSRDVVARLGVQARVHFLDWVPEEDLPALYNQADLVVLPSLIEGFGLPALEAMSCGTPVLAADNSSFPEVIGSAGLLVDPYNIDMLRSSMARILADPSLRQSMSMAGIRRAAHFSWDTAALRISQLYRSVLQEAHIQISNLGLPGS